MKSDNINYAYFEFYINIINCDFSEIYTDFYNLIRNRNILFNRTLPNNLVVIKSLEPKYSLLGEPVNATIISFAIKIDNNEYLNLYNKFKMIFDTNENILVMNIITGNDCAEIVDKSYIHYYHKQMSQFNYDNSYMKNNVLNFSYSTKHMMDLDTTEEETILKLFVVDTSDTSENKLAVQKLIYLLNKYNYFYLDKNPIITKGLSLNDSIQSSIKIISYEFRLFNFDSANITHFFNRDVRPTFKTDTNILGLRCYYKNNTNEKFDQFFDLYKLFDSIDLDKIY